jgi:signal transduction histidine kinase
VRIRVDVPDASLRRALSTLLEDAGHVVDASGRMEGVGLRILAEPGADASARPLVPTLYLRPGGRGRAAPAPGPALRTVLHAGGAVTWAPPLDPDLLVECLGDSGPRPVSLSAPLPWDGPLSRAPDPWLLFDPGTREVLWATDAARERYVHPGGARLARSGEDAIPAAVFASETGSEVRSLDGVSHLVPWWTDARGRRCVGVLRVAPEARTADEENLSTLAELGRVSAVTMHELRIPLASFAGALDLVEGEADADEREAVVRLARDRLLQMKTMLDDALRLVRPFRAAPEAVQAEDVVRSAVESTRTQALFARVALTVDTPERPLRAVLAHPEPLRRAVTNLLVNAAQAQGGGGSVRVRLDGSGPRGSIRVEDDGPGIPPDLREKVFAPFWTTKEGGSGLGLAYVKRVAEACGGRAAIEDAPRGACVRIDLPFASLD